MTVDNQLAKATQLLATVPKSKKALLSWEKNNVQAYQRSVVENIKQEYTIPEVTENTLETIVLSAMAINPRFLYSFFDSKGVYINVVHTGVGFSLSISGKTEAGETPSSVYPTREEAEQVGYEKAFNILENNL